MISHPSLSKLNSQLRQPKGEVREILQFHYTAWPDHGVPDSPHSLMSMLAMIRDAQPTNDVPLVIHCSAGVGRTGKGETRDVSLAP